MRGRQLHRRADVREATATETRSAGFRLGLFAVRSWEEEKLRYQATYEALKEAQGERRPWPA